MVIDLWRHFSLKKDVVVVEFELQGGPRSPKRERQ
jgi:hypothetical protein